MSMLVVTKGPVAMAGSTSIFCKIKGTTVPTQEAISIELQILSPTIIPREVGDSTKGRSVKPPNNIP